MTEKTSKASKVVAVKHLLDQDQDILISQTECSLAPTLVQALRFQAQEGKATDTLFPHLTQNLSLAHTFQLRTTTTTPQISTEPYIPANLVGVVRMVVDLTPAVGHQHP